MKGEFHRAAVAILASNLVIISQTGGADWVTSTALCLGCTSGVVVHPDLDQSDRYVSWKKPWRLYWWAYGKFVPHRHPLSHAPVIGTLGRLLYMLPLLFAAIFLMRALGIDLSPWGTEIGIKAIITFVGGLMLADGLHYLIDKISTNLKEKI